MKKFINILCIVILLLSITACSSNDENEKTNVSAEAEAIMNTLKPDERIDDYLAAHEALKNINIKNKVVTKTELKKLIKICDKYEELFKEEHFSPNFDGYLEDLKYNQGDSLESLEEKLDRYNHDFFYALVIPVYCEKKDFEMALPTSFEKFAELSNSSGYLYEDDQTYNVYSKKYYQYKSGEGSRGDYTIVTYDHSGRVGSYYFRLKNGDSWTAKQDEVFSNKTQAEAEQESVKIVTKNLNSLDIKNNLFLRLVYNDEEINKIQSIISNATEDWVRENNRAEWSNDETMSHIQVIQDTFEIGDTNLTLMGTAMSDIGIGISVKNFYYDKYQSDQNKLEKEYTGFGLFEEGEQEPTYRTIDEMINDQSISVEEKNSGANTEKTNNSTSSDEIFKSSIINTWLTVSREGDGSKKVFNYTFNADGTGSYTVNDRIIKSFSYTISNISQNGTHGTITCQKDKFNKVLAIDSTEAPNGVILINSDEFWLKGTRDV